MSSGALATLLVSGSDTKDLVACLADLVGAHGCTILDADQHADATSGMFFHRVRLRVRERSAGPALATQVARLADRRHLNVRLVRDERKKRIAIFVSKYDHCLYDLLLRQRDGELSCEVALVVSNHPDLEHVATQFGVPFFLLPVEEGSKAQQEARACALLARFEVDLIVLARYMQILSRDFVEAFPQRVINIHHSFLPAFMGGKPYHRAHDRGVKLIGATAHYATADLDEGPIIEQDVVRTSHRDSIEDLVRKGRDLERVALARAVKWHLEDRVMVHGNRTVVFA